MQVFLRFEFLAEGEDRQWSKSYFKTLPIIAVGWNEASVMIPWWPQEGSGTPTYQGVCSQRVIWHHQDEATCVHVYGPPPGNYHVSDISDHIHILCCWNALVKEDLGHRSHRQSGQSSKTELKIKIWLRVMVWEVKIACGRSVLLSSAVTIWETVIPYNVCKAVCA